MELRDNLLFAKNIQRSQIRLSTKRHASFDWEQNHQRCRVPKLWRTTLKRAFAVPRQKVELTQY